ncbi:MAG: glycerol-3-phosphate 1-O-acyltransferase PlsY [Fimbriimonadales bacterium]|nr:glycerol-3-phosphate 1-O-acyltransferase PlsY [Fimbriimonadales bacterium]MDW8051419.1 glycerol-3-phosphate 1-O-acyltransferase PlsY [Armatimonadota bacterium]
MAFEALLLALVAAFWVGALPFGFWVARLHGVDIRKVGSGNIGATNVFRVLGAKWGLTVLVLDALKGWLPTWVVVRSGADDVSAILVGVAAILGHTFSPLMGFRGGKGIATGLGALLAASPLTIAIAFPVWLVAFLATRWVSLGSILAAATVPIAAYFVGHSLPAVGILAAAAVVVIWKHRANIRRILRGTEPKLQWRNSRANLEQACLQLARTAVERMVLEGTRIEPDLSQLPDLLREPGSVFVALYQGEQLRGLMGSLVPQQPTRAHEIVYHATRAALLDPYHPPVDAAELPTLKYVVYLVESYEPLRDLEQVDPAHDGLWVEWQGKHAVLAPPAPNRSPQDQMYYAMTRCGVPRGERPVVYRVRLNRIG